MAANLKSIWLPEISVASFIVTSSQLCIVQFFGLRNGNEYIIEKKKSRKKTLTIKTIKDVKHIWLTDWEVGTMLRYFCVRNYFILFRGQTKLSTPNRLNGMTTHYYQIVQLNRTSRHWGIRWKLLKKLFEMYRFLTDISVMGHCRKCVRWETDTKNNRIFNKIYSNNWASVIWFSQFFLLIPILSSSIQRDLLIDGVLIYKKEQYEVSCTQ